ncbi:conserved hypothetical protein [Porphyromonas gingivalis W83]|uniref:Metallo-beta-lactamase domain-containing protein n=1 Tax=Porphyromonas gingivalis (strain ATCC BAA-308 / W83) TaxID=242619 RepID=Q7MW23_PORGI|nr:MBL fold metallo-hydrolase [Porphyromonas gingivalis]AAQ65990.1 conserved hypothetical protein [Porphyromonas gingivalis W83]USI94803.1 MBL fold metallo-hydrolase [Porphyromonas gingivalis]USI96631.1 MBL fold metallo-hydrolase [Porphyromonas gingivalis]USI98540.1 MBL fold metallo-hydrolase [Porphyromonas gingivalis]WCG00238.1 MBL fold metallo-hydrolase [Porphyromonas gingivalis]
MMKYIFRTFSCGSGDCIFLILKSGDYTLNLMIDCGKYTEEIDEYVRNSLKNKIDYLIVTHIDNDHINGLIKMLTQNPDLIIEHIIYNCYQRVINNEQPWTEQMKANVDRLYDQLPIVIDMLSQNVNEEKALTLAECILRKEEWRRAWQREYITDESPAIQLANNMGRIIFLSPSQVALDRLDVKYRKLFWQQLYKQKTEDYDGEETIYEALMRIAQLEEGEETKDENVNDDTINEQILKRYASRPLSKMDDNNIASIAFIWEYQGHRILLMGDADPEQVSNAIEKVYKDETKPVIFDLIKVSHHGSAHSTSCGLMDVIDSERFFFTGGGKERPSLQTLGRIIIRPLPNGIAYRDIRYNRPNEILNKLANLSVDEKGSLHIRVNHNENGYEVSC